MSNKFNSIETLRSLENDFSLWAEKTGVLPSDQAEFIETLKKKVGLVSTKIENIIRAFEENNFSPESVKKAARDLTGDVNENIEYVEKGSGQIRRYIFT